MAEVPDGAVYSEYERGAGICRELSELFQQPVQGLPESAQDSAAGQVNGVGCQPELGRDLGRRPPLDDDLPERLPRRRGELAPGELQGPVGEESPVLGRVDLRGRVVRPGDRVQPGPGRDREVLAPGVPELVPGHGAQPRPEAVSAVIAELGERFEQLNEHILYEVSRLSIPQPELLRPLVEQRCIEVDKLAPGGVVARPAEAVQEAGGRVRHPGGLYRPWTRLAVLSRSLRFRVRVGRAEKYDATTAPLRARPCPVPAALLLFPTHSSGRAVAAPSPPMAASNLPAPTPGTSARGLPPARPRYRHVLRQKASPPGVRR